MVDCATGFSVRDCEEDGAGVGADTSAKLSSPVISKCNFVGLRHWRAPPQKKMNKQASTA